MKHFIKTQYLKIQNMTQNKQKHFSHFKLISLAVHCPKYEKSSVAFHHQKFKGIKLFFLQESTIQHAETSMTFMH